MQDPASVVLRLQETPATTDKRQIIINAFMEGERRFFIGANLAYNAMITFGIKKVAELFEGVAADDANPFTFEQFIDLAEALRTRKLTGHSARDAINDAADRCDAYTWNGFYRRVLLRDLDCGATEGTINSALKKLVDAYPEARDCMVPVYQLHLAEDGADPKHAKKLKGRKLIDIKLDGVRLASHLDKAENTVIQRTRNGMENENFTLLREKLAEIMKHLPASVILDAEVVSTSFNDLMTQLNRGSKVDTSNARLALFDMIPMSDFDSEEAVCLIPQEKRHEALSSLAPMLSEISGGLIFVVPKLEVDLDTEEGQKVFAQFNRDALEAGYEGIMVKDPNAPYVRKRSAAWLKVKPFIETDLEIVGWEYGEANGKLAKTIGTIVCRGEDNGRPIEVKSSGFTDAERQWFWENRDNIKGLIVTIRADGISKERGSDVWSLRFPRYKGRRGFVAGEKL